MAFDSNSDFNREITRRIARFKEDIDLEDLAAWLGMEKPKRSGNWRAPNRPDNTPSVSIYNGGRAWKDHKFDDVGGSCIDLVMYVRNCDQWEAIVTLHDYVRMDLPARDQVVRSERTREEFIADKCIQLAERAVPYLVEQRLIPEATVRAAIKAKTVGFNDYVNPRVAEGEPGHLGDAAAFIVRAQATNQVTAVDLRFLDAAKNGDVKTWAHGPKVGLVWLPHEWRKMRDMKTVYIVESPINALSVMACNMPFTTAIATRGVAVNEIDWSFLIGKQCVLCYDADKADDKGRRAGPECAWRVYDLLTALNIATTHVDQASWIEDELNDVNDVLKVDGVEGLKRRLRRFEDCAIAGLSNEREPPEGRKRVFLPSWDFSVYWRFRTQADYSSYVTERTDGEDGKEKIEQIPMAGFRVAAITRITVQSPSATTQGVEDPAPNVLFAATVQVPRHGPSLQRRVFNDNELHKPAKWQDFGTIYNPQQFFRLIAIMERTTHLGARRAANLVGVCWLEGKLVVSEGPDCYFEKPDKQCDAYHSMRFNRGPVAAAKQVVKAYQSTFRESAALMPLIWILGAPALKCVLGFWPHMEMQADKGSGKSTLIGHLRGSTGFTMFSSQQLKSDYRIICSVSHTTMPVGWEEISTLPQMRIDSAVGLLQECYQFTPHTRGSDNLHFLNAAPVLLAGEDVPMISLAGKLVRTTLTEGKRGALIPQDLPPFPMRAWLDWIVQQDVPRLRERFATLEAWAVRMSRASGVDVGAKRMAGNYASLILAWSLVCEFAGIEDAGDVVKNNIVAEMNQHIAQTSKDREPYVWILEKLASELAANRFLFQRSWEYIPNKTTGQDELCLLIRPSYVMDHLSTATHLREWFSALPVKTARVFKRQCMTGGLVLDDEATYTNGGVRHYHALALSIKAMQDKGISMPVPENVMRDDDSGREPPRAAPAQQSSMVYSGPRPGDTD